MIGHDTSPPPAAGRVLVVCTGNVCRSPYIERVLAHRLRGTDIDVASAGTRALTGWLMDQESKRLLRRTGGDATGFVARQLTAQMVREADLVIVAEEKHRQEVVRMEPTALRSTFRLTDLSDLLAKRAPRRAARAEAVTDPARTTVARLVDSAHERRTRGLHAAFSRRGGDLYDPFGKDVRDFDRMAAQVDSLLPPVVRTLRGLHVQAVRHG